MKSFNMYDTSSDQSDALERRITRYRQVSGSRFLASLWEVYESSGSPVSYQRRKFLQGRHPENKEDWFWAHWWMLRTPEEWNSTNRQDIWSCHDNYRVRRRETFWNQKDANVVNAKCYFMMPTWKLFVPSKALSEFVCHCFAIIDPLELQILSMSGKAKKAGSRNSFIHLKMVQSKTWFYMPSTPWLGITFSDEYHNQQIFQ